MILTPGADLEVSPGASRTAHGVEVDVTDEQRPPLAPEPARGRRISRVGRRRAQATRVERRPLPTSSPWYVPATALGVISLLLLGFCLQVLLIGDASFARAQQLALADFRYNLARATAPVGQSFTPQPKIQTSGAGAKQQAAPAAPVPVLWPLGSPVAVMSIGAIGLRNTVVLEGTTPKVTQKGPGHERNSVLPGQEGWSLVYGRAWSYGGVFGRIDTLKRGDRITLTTGQGRHTYAVTGVRRAGDPLPKRDQGQGRLVLGTAAGDAFAPTGVVYVDAVLTSAVVPTPPRQALALQPGEAIMAGDSTAWFAVLLWVQGLMVAVLGLTWARNRWGRTQTWIVGVPVLAALGIGTADTLVRLLPNVL